MTKHQPTGSAAGRGASSSGPPDLLAEFTQKARDQLVGNLHDLAPHGKVIHVAYCAHTNPGDNAIAVAEDRLLKQAHGRRAIKVTTEELENDFPAVRRIFQKYRDYPLLSRGGGSLTDLYPEAIEWHVKFITASTDRPILQMPQSIYFGDLSSAESLRRAIGDHPNYRLLVRDQRSLEWATEYLECETTLAPDSVLSMEPRTRHLRSTQSIGMVARQDGEVLESRGDLPNLPDIPWMTEPRAYQDPRLLPARLRARVDLPTGAASLLAQLAARGRLSRAIRMLSKFDLVVADRLHAALICIMNGVSVIAVDNSYGKLSSAFDTWKLDELADATLVGSFAEAVALAEARRGS